MAKKKENKRRTYDLGSKDVITYEKSPVQRKMNFLVLRGPGILQTEIEAQNTAVQNVTTKLHIKVKFVTVKTEEEIIANLKDANVWAGGVVYNAGTLEGSENVKKTVKKLLIPVKELSETEADVFVDAVKELVKKIR